MRDFHGTGSTRSSFALALALGCALLAAAEFSPANAQNCNNLFDTDQVLDFHVTMDPVDWEALRFSCPGGLCGPRPHFYWSAMLRCEDGPEIHVGIRRKNGKADPSETDPRKPGIKIDINEFVSGQLFLGKAKFNLENGSGSSGPNGDGGNDNGIREGVSWALYQDSGVLASRVAWVNLWVNGDYKGLYTHVEQIDKEFLADHGIDEGGWLFKGPSNDQRTREGEPNPFAFNWYPFDHTNPADPQPPDWHDQTEWRVDMQQTLTLAAVTNFVGNKDAVVFKNNNYWYYDWSVFPAGQRPRLYLPWDLDTTMKGQQIDEPILGTPTNNGHMAQGLLRDDPIFQADYYQIYNDLMSGPLSLASIQARVDAIETAIAADLDADPNQTAGTAAEQFQSVRDFLQARTTFVLGALGDCPDGTCDPGETPCTCPADCGTPPVTETICTDLFDDDCDGPVDCADADCVSDPGCESLPTPNLIVVNEVVANSPESPDVEFVEILNVGPGVQDLAGWYLLDDNNSHDKCFLEGTLDVGEYLVVAGFIDDFSARYPEAITNLNPSPFDSDVSGSGFGLSDDGDSARLFRPGPQGDEFVSGYTFGPQTEEIPFAYLPEVSDAPEYVTFPTPGASNDLTAAFSPICINEFLTTSAAGGVDDWIELYNRGSQTVDIGGWHLSDNASQPTKYAFPPGTSIPAGGFLTIDETELGFSLSSTGSEVILLTHVDAATGQDYFDYGPQFPDVTRGRFPDGTSNWVFFGLPSRGLRNACGVENLLFTAPDHFEWDAVVGAAFYDVVHGDLQALLSSNGNFSSAVQSCLEDDTVASGSDDTNSPASGEGFFYLVRPVGTECGAGSYDALSMTQTTARDAGVNGAAGSCP